MASFNSLSHQELQLAYLMGNRSTITTIIGSLFCNK
jgi:hypothetical protein